MTRRTHALSSGRPRIGMRPRKRRFLLVVGGEVTEPCYFKGLERELGDVVLDVRSFSEDPAKLAEHAKQLQRTEKGSHSSRHELDFDTYECVFVVTDVDQFTPTQLQTASTICREEKMELIISNPCFEVWLIDHLQVCPTSCCDPLNSGRKASELGIVYGSRSKYVEYDLIRGRSIIACDNAARHNCEENRRKRSKLDVTDFAPWTDMPVVVKRIQRKKK